MSATPVARSRIVVAVDTDVASDWPLDIVRHLLRDAATTLVGLFVEDRRLFEHAASALAREVAFSGHARPLESRALERQLRARAAEARRRFEASATQLKLPHDFQVLRGDIVTELLRAGASADAVVVAAAANTAATHAWYISALQQLVHARLPAVLFARESWRTGRGIVAVVEQGEDTADALGTGLKLAEGSRSSLTLLLAGPDQAERRTVADAAAALAASVGVDLRVPLMPTEITPDTIVHAVRGARLVVLAHKNETHTADLVTTLVARTHVPLLFVGRRDEADQASVRDGRAARRPARAESDQRAG